MYGADSASQQLLCKIAIDVVSQSYTHAVNQRERTIEISAFSIVTVQPLLLLCRQIWTKAKCLRRWRIFGASISDDLLLELRVFLCALLVGVVLEVIGGEDRWSIAEIRLIQSRIVGVRQYQLFAFVSGCAAP